jgi:NADH:ubiquinone oxidoreductase subunit K
MRRKKKTMERESTRRRLGRGIVGRRGNKRNVRRRIIAVEIMLLARNRERRVAAVARDDRVGVIAAIRVRTVAAGETAVGLGRRVVYYRVHGTIGREERNRRQS